MTTPKKDVAVSARVVQDIDVAISKDTLLEYAINFIGDNGYYEEFAAHILVSEKGLDVDDLGDVRDADIAW